MTNIHHYVVAREKARKATTREHEIFHEAFPIGSTVQWMHCGHIQTGVVKSHNSYHWGEAVLWAENSKTGKKVKVSGHSILEAQP